MSDEDSKTEQPTEKHLREAVDEGRFARTPDLQGVFVLTAAYCVLAFSAKEHFARVASISIGIFSHLGKYAIKPEAISDWVALSARTLLELALPMAVSCALAGLLAGGLQSRFQLTPKVLGFNLARLNPMSGLQRIFSVDGAVKVATDTLKLAVVGMVVWGGFKKVITDPIFYTPVPINRLGEFIGSSAIMLLGRFIFALGSIAGLNYLYQLRKISNELKMSHSEVKEEGRQSEGDPKVKAAMRQMAKRMSQRQMLSAVATADVVVTNPTHFAVALKYERGKDKAPMLLAKGDRAFAKRIKAIAAAHEVPMIENKPVARMLFKAGRVGKPIPLELYQAVADILAFVYRTHRYYFHQLKQRRAQS